MLQEHWLFECQINNIGEINDSIHFAGKGVDKHNPIEPTQMPRGYGGVAILWTDNIDHLVRPLTDGSERIQCIELSLPERKLIVVSVYLPTTGGRDSLMEFQECVDQISEITEKYCQTHDILLGGDLNEDLDKNDPTKRTKYLQNLITDYNLHYTSTGKTFTNSSGVDCSEIDYFLYRTTKYEVVQEKTILYLNDSVSDHYPIQIKLNCVLHGDRVEKVKIKPNASKINWRKVDKDGYQNLVESEIYKLSSNKNYESNHVDENITNLVSIMKGAAEKCAPKKKTFYTKPKLKVWTAEISNNLKSLRTATRLWIGDGKPRDPHNEYLITKKECKRNFRRSYRRELAKRSSEEKMNIITTRNRDPKLFHKLVNKQRGKRENFTEELLVEENCYSGPNQVLEGFKNILKPWQK